MRQIATTHCLCCPGITALSEIIGAGVLILDSSAELVFANTVALGLMGCKSEEEARRCWRSYIRSLGLAGEDRLKATRPARLALDIPHPDGGRLLGLEIHTLDPESQGGYLALLRDRQTIDALESELLVASRMRTQAYLAAGLIHGLVAPLNAMKITLELLELSVNDDTLTQAEELLADRRRYVTVLKSELERFNRYVQSLRQQAMPLPSVMENFDLGATIEEIIKALEYPMRLQKVQMHFAKPDGAVKVRGNREQVKQAVFNLIIQALRAIPEGGKLNAELGKMSGKAHFVLQNDGPASSQALLDEVDRLYLNAPKDAASLGLYLARRVAEMHGGTMAVEPQLEKGTRVCWSLPL